MERFNLLQEMGREPINLPADIYFAGDEILQKTPGNHHRPEFRKTGTYNHPNVRKQRQRVAQDRATRLINGKMTEVELRKVGGMDGLNKALAEFGLKIDEEQMEVALMNANMLAEEGNAKRMDRDEAKRKVLAEHGIVYQPIEAEKTAVSPQQHARDAAAAAMAKPEADEDLSSLKDESEKDGNELKKGEEGGAKDGVAVKFVPAK